MAYLNEKKLFSVVQVKEVPVEEPLPEYEGSYNVTSNGTLPTANKKMTQDLVVNVADTGEEIINNTIEEVTTNATRIRRYLFADNSQLKKITGLNVTRIANYCFNNCTSLIDVNLPLASPSISNDQYIFYNCTSLQNISLPAATMLTYYMFGSCSSLITASFENATRIDQYCFRNCNALISITLGASSVCSVQTNSLPASSSHHMTIYVPSDLIESYQTATNWSTLYNNGYIDFQAITE